MNVIDGRINRLVLVTLLGVIVQSSAAAASRQKPISEAVLDVNSGKILYVRQADVVRPPASLTKMMTLFLVFDALEAGSIKLTEKINISKHAAAQQPSRLGLKAGNTITIKSAVRAVAVDSANDASVALAERLSGSEKSFARLMTRKAGELGLRRTKFANATGLTNIGNQTTARDVATLSSALIRTHPSRYAVFGLRSIAWVRRTIPNHNHLLGHVPGVDGIKTGYTADAGYNLSASAKRKGRRVIVVVLGERNAGQRDVRVSDLLERGFTDPTGSPPHSRE